jgi:uncharacterized membrane protein YdjX (TVP38/TMEM64 family)
MNPVKKSLPDWGRWLVLALYLALIIVLVFAWQDPVLRHHLQPEALAQSGKKLLNRPFGALWVLLGYVVAAASGVPTSIMVTVGVMVFSPWPGVAYALAGMVSGAVVIYAVGRYSGAAFIDRWTRHGRMRSLATVLQKEGLKAVFIIRAVPIAPFVLVSLTAGAFRIPFGQYVAGTLLGLMPGTLMMGLFWDRVKATLEHPNWLAYGVLVFLLVLVALTVRWFKRKLAHEHMLQE